jgi:hypothetical protein
MVVLQKFPQALLLALYYMYFNTTNSVFQIFCNTTAHTTQNDLGFVVPPLEGVGLRHGDESEQTRSLTLPPAAPVFATQPLTLFRMISG